MAIKDGFKVSYYFIFPLCCLIELVCGFMSSENILDNGCLIAIIVLLLIQVILLISSKLLSGNTKEQHYNLQQKNLLS